MSLPSTPTFVPRLETLPLAQRALWPDLARLSALGFVLYGGTAIALRLGHRASVDFDFFTDRPLDKAALRAACAFIAQSTVLQDTPDTFTVLIPPASFGAPDHPDPDEQSRRSSVPGSFHRRKRAKQSENPRFRTCNGTRYFIVGETGPTLRCRDIQ